ncbi:MaoC family dehydratase [Nocardioides sp. DS6]|uniref:MaoC family dehydratase n=1 Tax=Nocardioides eburneus TaxID=3231482 RepID=A0ABV3SVT8_9ACTN
MTEPTLVTRTGVSALLRAALPSVPVVGALPGIRKDRDATDGFAVTRPSATVEREQVERYAVLCGFPVKDTVPVTYPHMLAAPLHLAVLSDPRFPSAAMGMVHVENSISQHRPIAIGETLEVTTAVGAPLPHPVGTAWALTTTVSAAGETVWESVSTYLRRGRRNPDATWPDELVDVPPSGPVFALRSDLGRRYAAVSGDYNPIHLTTLSAKALGFPRHIAHGMWTKARCLAALENRLSDAVRIDVAFKKPVFLPSSVAFGSRPAQDGNGYDFSLHRRGSDTLHLLGRTRAL